MLDDSHSMVLDGADTERAATEYICTVPAFTTTIQY